MNRIVTVIIPLLIVVISTQAVEAQENLPPAAAGAPTCMEHGSSCTVEQYLLAVLGERGVESAMAALDSLAARDEEVHREGHGYAHAIGIAAYTGDEEVGVVFNRCTPAYQSGCYHGVIQAYFVEHAAAHGGDLDASFVNALCRVQREADDRWLLFQCAHGMGHGLVMLADYSLPASLAGCDLVEDAWERESCYGGVFMENIVHATVPHHTPGRPEAGSHAGHDGHAGHGDDGHRIDHGRTATAAEEFPPLKRDDPLYPCNVLDDRYLVACYQMQTSAILFFNGYDLEEAAKSCGTAPASLRTVCFQSLGRDISSITLQDHRRAMRLCSSTPGEYQPWCTIGYAKNLVDVTADPDDGFASCRLLPAGESKRVCYIAIGEQIWVLADEPERREAMCRRAESAFVAECRLGAGLPDGPTTPGDRSARGEARSRSG
jgi:hypothetical protein